MSPRRRFHTARGARFLLRLLILSAAIAGRGAAQFSPGPLSSAHADLEGATKCLACHGLKNGGEMSGQCLACHKGIARLAADRRGLHGRDGHGDCTSCHIEHKGRDASLIDRAKLAAGTFDHAETGWPLSGKHVSQKCEACHKREGQSPEILALEPKPEALHEFIGLRQECAACHKDPHEGHLGTNCADCHRESGFHDVVRERFLHDRTSYPLRGAHAKVECAKCHDPVTAWGRKPAYGTCGGCHTDAHAGQASISGQRVDCSSCHGEEKFGVTSFDRQRHRSTTFPLEGKHGEVACEKCHAKNPKGVAPGSLGAAGIMIRRPHGRCDDCHVDAHAGQFAGRADKGDCRTCHTVEGWKKSLWDVAQHQTLSLPLTGRHAKVPCADCHGAERAGGWGLAAATGGTAGAGAMIFKLGKLGCEICHVDPHDGRYVGVDLSDRDDRAATWPGRAVESSGSPDDEVAPAGSRDRRASAAGAPDGEVAAAGSFAGKRACASCHDTERFRPSRVGIQEHGRFDYPLDGAHRAVACVTCHADLAQLPLASSLIGRGDSQGSIGRVTGSGSDRAIAPEASTVMTAASTAALTTPPKAQLSFTRKHDDCVDCHTDVHEGQLKGPCARCHETDAFRPASKFVHDRDAAFPLAGAHSKVACDRCHAVKEDGAGRRHVTYRPVDVACATCHADTPSAVAPARTGP